MELLERDGPLATLTEACDAAARGDGHVVVVTGEPGIGKTSLVNRFVRDLGPGTRVLLGSCDDLSIPRPLGPLHDFAGTVPGPFEEALAGGAPPHEIHRLLDRPFANRWLNLAILWELVLVVLVVNVPVLQGAFGTRGLSLGTRLTIAVVALTIVPVLEVAKRVIRRRRRHETPAPEG